MPESQVLTVAVCQTDAALAGEARLRAVEPLLAEASARGADVAVLPELFHPGYGQGEAIRAAAEAPGGPFAERMAGLARRMGLALVYGYPERAGDKVYNAALCLDRQGQPLANHRKMVLPTDYERDLFDTQVALTLFDLQGWRAALLICFDTEFPEAVRACALAGAEVILAPTALGADWSVVAEKMIPTRALESGVFLAYANYAGSEGDMAFLGKSRIAGPHGKEAAVAGGGPELLVARLAKKDLAEARRILPYLEEQKKLRFPG